MSSHHSECDEAEGVLRREIRAYACNPVASWDERQNIAVTMEGHLDFLVAASVSLEEQFETLKSAAQEVEGIAFRQYLDWMHFHETAIADPFVAEGEAQDFSRRISSLLTVALGNSGGQDVFFSTALGPTRYTQSGSWNFIPVAGFIYPNVYLWAYQSTSANANALGRLVVNELI